MNLGDPVLHRLRNNRDALRVRTLHEAIIRKANSKVNNQNLDLLNELALTFDHLRILLVPKFQLLLLIVKHLSFLISFCNDFNITIQN